MAPPSPRPLHMAVGLPAALALCSVLGVNADAPAAVVGTTPTGDVKYELVGHGWCVDSRGRQYEQWYMDGWKSQALIYKNNNLASCDCPECRHACDHYLMCLGYEYYCCPDGGRCIGGGAVLFSQGRRPGAAPPGNFSLIGPMGSGTSGADFQASGPIAELEGGGDDPNAFCYKKVEPVGLPAQLPAIAASPRIQAVVPAAAPNLAALPVSLPEAPPLTSLLNSASASENVRYELVGNGYCVDNRGRQYEQWYMEGWKSQALMYKESNLASCDCPECRHACDHYLVCLGFEYYCCPEGERCIGGGAVLFSHGRRPGVAPPGNFSLVGPMRSGTSGADFQGSGPIAGLEDGGDNPNAFCYKKVEPVGLPAELPAIAASPPMQAIVPEIERLPATSPAAPPAAQQPASQFNSAVASADVKYELVGHGWCLDAHDREYEHWYMQGWKSQALIYKENNLASCDCPECRHACDHYLMCLGYHYYCCPEGERCFGGGAVLFSQGLRPGVSPPGNFSLVGQRGSATSGADFRGSGPIAKLEGGGDDPHAFCYRKEEPMGQLLPPSDVKVGSYYEPHTMEGTARTVEASWSVCANRCRSTDGCVTWAYWPDGGCYLQSGNTVLLQAACPTDKPLCGALGVITGTRGTTLPRATRAIGNIEMDVSSTGKGVWDAQTILGKAGLGGFVASIMVMAVAGASLYMFAPAACCGCRKYQGVRNASKRKQATAGSEDDENMDSTTVGESLQHAGP